MGFRFYPRVAAILPFAIGDRRYWEPEYVTQVNCGKGSRVRHNSSSSVMVSRRRIIAIVLAAIAAIELTISIAIVLGFGGFVRLGIVRIRVQGFDKPFYVGLALSACLLILQWRRIRWRCVGTLLVASFVVVALANLVRTAPAFNSQGDLAVDELYVLLAVKHRLLLGPYSRFLWHHPGPLYFVTQAPLYALSGFSSASLYAGAIAINLAAFAILVWVVARGDRGLLAVSIPVGALWFAHRTGGLLASPWTAHVPVMSSLAFVVSVAGMAAGRIWLLPIIVLLGSFITQTHVAYVPLVIVLSTVALASSVYLGWRDHAGSPWPSINAAAWLFVGLWVLPIAEQLSHAPGNVTRLWQFFAVDQAPTQPIGVSIGYWSHALLRVFAPVLRLPWGEKADMADTVRTVSAVVLVSCLPIAGLFAFKAKRRWETSIAGMAFLASLVGLWSITRIRGEVLQHDIIWLTGLGVIDLAIVLTAAVRVARDRLLPGWGSSIAADVPILVVAIGVLCELVATSVGLGDFNGLVGYEATKRRPAATMMAADSAIRRYLAAERIARPLVEINADWGMAAGTFVELEKAGTEFAVPDAWLFMFSDAYAQTGREDAVVTFDRFRLHQALSLRPTNVVLLEDDLMNVDAIRVGR